MLKIFRYLSNLRSQNSNHSVLKHPSVSDRKRDLEAYVHKVKFHELDPGVLSARLVTWLKRSEAVGDGDGDGDGSSREEEGHYELSYQETQAAMTQLYGRIEHSYASYFDVLEIESTWPRLMQLHEKREIYQYSEYPTDSDGQTVMYPPHLQVVPKSDSVPLGDIFSKLGLVETQNIIQRILPKNPIGDVLQWIFDDIDADIDGDVRDAATQPPSMRAFEDYNRNHRKSGTDIKQGNNIGLLEDWYSDRRFAEQSFTGANPTSVERVPRDLLAEFIEAASYGGYTHWAKTLPTIDPASLFVQDNRYFRKAFGARPDEELRNQEPDNSGPSWTCVAVTLFQLHDNGQLHPIAIVIDYKVNMKNSVTIFNKSKKPLVPKSDAKGIPDQENDWPWRYAKTCAQVSDWIRHEVGVHLTRAHFIEEAIIVATHRTIPMDHIVFKLLEPHWYKTLSINAAARTVLISQAIKELLGLKEEYMYQYIRSEFETLNYVDSYVPNDLKKRGFPNTLEELARDKYKNYAYAKNMLAMWITIRKYVRGMLLTSYNEARADREIAADPYLAGWTYEVRKHGWIKTFPEIKTLEDLTDVVTMSIHIAAPFHTAVNYLQNFYQAFVPAKPPSLCQAPPATLEELKSYNEEQLVKALPIGRKTQWLLAVQIPWLLSFKVADDRNLISFAQSQWQTHGGPSETNKKIRVISAKLYSDLYDLSLKFIETSRRMDVGSIPYMVLDPSTTAVSILI